MPAFSILALPRAAWRTSSMLARMASMRALISSGERSRLAPLTQRPFMFFETTSLRSKSSPQCASISRTNASPASLVPAGSFAPTEAAVSSALASNWPWSTRIGVVVTLPFTSTVRVQLNLTGRPAGSEHLTVTAPVVSSRESVKVRAMCSSETIP